MWLFCKIQSNFTILLFNLTQNSNQHFYYNLRFMNKLFYLMHEIYLLVPLPSINTRATRILIDIRWRKQLLIAIDLCDHFILCYLMEMMVLVDGKLSSYSKLKTAITGTFPASIETTQGEICISSEPFSTHMPLAIYPIGVSRYQITDLNKRLLLLLFINYIWRSFRLYSFSALFWHYLIAILIHYLETI